MVLFLEAGTKVDTVAREDDIDYHVMKKKELEIATVR